MARDVQIFDVVVSPGGTAAAPVAQAMTMPARKVVGIEVIIPSGVRGTVHFALGSHGTRLYPSNAGAYITGDNEKLKWDLSEPLDSGAWQLIAYNSGNYPHTLQVRFLLQLVQDTAQQPVRLLNPASITG